MVKINPITKINPEIKTKAIQKAKEALSVPEIKTASAAAAGSFGIILSTTLQDFNKTVEKENFFKLKTNPETGKPYEPDVFQKAAGINLYLGNDVLVTAPTGTGKTAIAEYIITKNLKEGKKTFYTTPLKALSNEKFRDFCKTYGEENVGLLTGDTKINPDAPIVIMTTEVYRNMTASEKFNFGENLYKGIPNGLRTVIFDELQYLGDIDRGGIWEQAIMFTPRNTQMLSLSATIGNNTDINNWISSVKREQADSVTPDNTYKPVLNEQRAVLINVPPENRHVPLNFEIEHAVHEIKMPRGGTKAEKIKARQEGARTAQSIYAKPNDESYKKLTRKLANEGKLPAIYFVFSKKDSRHLLKYLSTESELLTTEKEQKEIKRIINKYKSDGIYLGESLNFDALLKGYAVHNAGLLPAQKQLVEELFQKKLLKVVIATETLSAGINMPAKTTVISSPRKPASTSDGGVDRKRNLTPNEFHQMAGRAGRRGIDTEGFCIPLSCNPEQTKLYQQLINSPSNNLDSSLELDFSFIAKYLSKHNNEAELKNILSKSLYAYDTESGNVNKEKLEKLINGYKIKKGILEKEGYLGTLKGELLGELNGYEQIPVINLLTDKNIVNLTPVELAGLVGGLANIEYDTKGDFPKKPFALRVDADQTFRDAVINLKRDIENYSKTTAILYPDKELSLEPRRIDHLYTWASLNLNTKESRKAWKELLEGNLKGSIRDEGSLFKEITMTTDLLKQMTGICQKGYNLTNDRNFQILYLKLQEALNLIQREPADETL